MDVIWVVADRPAPIAVWLPVNTVNDVNDDLGRLRGYLPDALVLIVGAYACVGGVEGIRAAADRIRDKELSGWVRRELDLAEDDARVARAVGNITAGPMPPSRGAISAISCGADSSAWGSGAISSGPRPEPRAPYPSLVMSSLARDGCPWTLLAQIALLTPENGRSERATGPGV